MYEYIKVHVLSQLMNIRQMFAGRIFVATHHKPACKLAE